MWEISKKIFFIKKIFQIWRKTTSVMDEVDLLLHPLKSELNFPISKYVDLDIKQERFEIPIFLIGLLNNNIPDIMKQKNVVVNEIKNINNFLKSKESFQQSPHLVLLNKNNYIEDVKPKLSKLSVLYLKLNDIINIKKNDDSFENFLNKKNYTDLKLEEYQYKVLNLFKDWFKILK